MDVQRIGLQSTQTRRNTGKQGARTRGTLHIFPSIPKSVAAQHINQAVFQFFCNLELISISYIYHAPTDVVMLGKMC